MFKSLNSCAGVLAITAIVVGVSVAGLAAPAGGADGGNSANAKLCQNDGFQSWVRADHTPFVNVGDCVSYAAGGGTLTPPPSVSQLLRAPPPSASQLLCESCGGTFGNDVNLIDGIVISPSRGPRAPFAFS